MEGKIDFAAVARGYYELHNSPLSKDAAVKQFMRLKEKMVGIGLDGGTKGWEKGVIWRCVEEKTVKKEDYGDEQRAVKESPFKKVKK
jgi:hypothetical protein